jgi:BirA family biotin operon repressor/biotin-[acetyl-CoA-carboxylase] ligase
VEIYNDYPGFITVVKLKSCDSTNNYLKQNYEKLKHKFPVVVAASQQTKGRGRDNRTWESKKNLGLYSSYGFHLAANIKFNFLPLTTGIAVIETLDHIMHIPRPNGFTLKWPNDILYENRKIAGILIENTIFEKQVFCVVGIGINVAHTWDDFPTILRDTATSLKLIAQADAPVYNIDNTSKVLAHIFFSRLDKLIDNETDEIIEKANRFSSFSKGRAVTFHRGEKMIAGVFVGIDRDGGLILETPGGGREIYYTGRIFL